MTPRKILLGMALCALLPVLPRLQAEEEEPLLALPEIRISLPGGDYVVEWLTPQELAPFWKPFQTLLEEGSLDEFAWVLPYVRHVLDLCQTQPELEPYTDWLRAQLDYLEFAALLVTLHPPERPPPPLPPLPMTLTDLRLPSLPAPPSVAPDVRRKRNQDSQSRELWKKTLQTHPLPASAIRLVPHLKAIFQKEGVPPELVWMAEVESSFNPRARSPAGAVGLFQFMPATAERFGLRRFPWDERESPTRSAQAAARYLRLLYQQFGDWALTLAAYNAGEGRVGRALQKSGASRFDEVASLLPTETQLYVPRVFTLIELREGVTPETLPPPKT